MAKKPLDSIYELPNAGLPLTDDELRQAFTDFRYLTANCMQVVDKNRRLVPLQLNRMQTQFFETLLPMIDPKTRLDKHRTVVWLKPRQGGGTVGLIAFLNYICSFAEGIENFSIIHSLPVTDTISKLTKKKVEPIITGIHPDIMPTIEKEVLGTGIMYNYKDILGIPRHNFYELVSANTSSIRSDTINIWIADECLGGDTEVLTSTGYKKMRDITKDDLVAQFSSETEQITFANPIRLIDKVPTRKVYDVKLGDNDHVVMTGGHELLLKSTNTGKYSKRELEDVKFTQQWHMPVANVNSGDAIETLSPRERLLIALQADGHLIEGVGVTRARISLKKDRKKERLIQILNDCVRDNVISWNGKDEPSKRKDYSTWNFCLNEIIDFKNLTNVFSFNETPEKARAIINEMLEWDGYKGTSNKPAMYYSSIVEDNVDLFCALGCLAGYRASKSVQHDDRKDNHSDVYRGHLSKNKFRQLGEMSKQEIEWNEHVYCVSMPDENIVIRVDKHHYIVGNCAFYRKPEELEDTIGGAMPDNGFSLTVFISTFDDMKGSFFKKKISDAIENPETMDFIFTPWFYVYPEKPMGYTLEDIELSEYDTSVIMPAFEKFNYPKELWADAIKWYHNKSLTVSNMKKEFPTTLEEIMALGENKCVFSDEALEWQRNNIELGMPCTLVTDQIDKSVKAVETDVSSFKIFKSPQPGHKYIEVVDPITAQNEDTDFFAMSIFDMQTLEQVATFMDKDMSVEDYADICVSAAKIYNRATICPESNVADALLVCIRALNYYNLYYETPQKRVKKDAGIRTSVSTKAAMIDKLSMLLEQHRIILHDERFINQLSTFEKKVKTRADGSQTVKLEARKGHHDDGVAVTWIFAGTLDQRQMMGSKHSGFAIL